MDTPSFSNAPPQGLAATFDHAANIYHQARPRYPEALYEALLTHTGLNPHNQRLLEIGCATGVATQPLAQLGFHITALEPGPQLAQQARTQLKSWSKVNVLQSSFEAWQPTPTFDLVYAATAWHWLDATHKYQLAAQALVDGGHLAFWSAQHVFPEDGDSFFKNMQAVYEEIDEGLPRDANWPAPGELTDQAQEIQDSGLFELKLVQHFDWQTQYDAEGYIQLLNTFSGHIAMAPWKRARLFHAIRERLASRTNPTVRRHWGCVLHIAKKTGKKN